jgi:hypothetical protein
MSKKYIKALEILWKIDIVIAMIFLATLWNSTHNKVNPQALLGAGIMVLLAAISYNQKVKLNRSKTNNDL